MPSVEVEVEIEMPSVEVEVEIEMPSVEVEVEIEMPSVEVEVEVEMPSVEVEVEVEVEVPGFGGGFGVDLGAGVEVEIEMPSVEVEVEIELPQVEVEIEMPGFGGGLEVELEVEVELPAIETEVEICGDVEIVLAAPDVEFVVDIDSPEGWATACATKPSWSGWFEQDGSQTDMLFEWMQLNADGTVYGEGSDPVGAFTLIGTVGDAGDVAFVKQYEGAHAVNYNGQLTGGTIAGNWEIPDNCGGTFELNLSSDYVENWTGWFEQAGENTDMALDIHIDETGVFGMGADPVGTFMVRGIYD
jgi:hypothetical protein